MPMLGQAALFLVAGCIHKHLFAVAVHYTCASDEVSGEVQGETGVVCGPRCREGTFDCPTDVPDGVMAQPQCMLQDADQMAFCGLLCQVDTQCPSGASCRKVGSPEVGLCIHPLSFSEWARQGSRRKLAVGWPARAGQTSRGFQIAKAYAALQSLKRRYGIADGDADVLVVKELLSTANTAGATAAQTPSLNSGGSFWGGVPQQQPQQQSQQPPPQPVVANNPQGPLAGFRHDINYFAHNVRDGIPGLEREIHDTVWNIEHITSKGTATMMLRGVIMVSLVYLGVGSAYNYNSFGARGLDMIPHIGFWMEYPAMVADGIKYCGIVAGDTFSGQGGASRGFQPLSSDRDTFAHFEPSK